MNAPASQIRLFTFGLKLGIIVFPSFFILDYFVYPEYKYLLLAIRIGFAAYLGAILLFVKWLKGKYFYKITLFTILFVSILLSSMCFLTGDGFASPYYSGLLQVIIITSLISYIPPKQYAMTMGVVISQHFILQSFLPWQFNDLLINVLAIGVFSIVAVIIHQFVFELIEENKSLKGLLPICAHCKKVRDDEGFWNQIETYIQKNSEAEFTHSMCPECSEALYGKESWYIKMKQKKTRPSP